MSSEFWDRIKQKRVVTYELEPRNQDRIGEIRRGDQIARDQALDTAFKTDDFSEFDAYQAERTMFMDDTNGRLVGNDELMELLGREKANEALRSLGVKFCLKKGKVNYYEDKERKECVVFAAVDVSERMTTPKQVVRRFQGNGMFILVWSNGKGRMGRYDLAFENYNDRNPIYTKIIEDALNQT